MLRLKYFLIGTGILFASIAYIGYRKNEPTEPSQQVVLQEIPIPSKEPPKAPPEIIAEKSEEDVNLIPLLFALDSSRLPLVETISYTSRVPWLKDRPAWISDYASHYETSRHFIARSLNRKPDYLSQKVGPGDRFNVFKKDKNIQFRLIIDLSKNKMRFYALDGEEKLLLKTYSVGTGRTDPLRKSRSLTPLGTYKLGERIAIYKPGTMGFFQDTKSEMIRIFGTRWIPFEGEIKGCTESAKGLGIHGCPWIEDPETGELVEDRSKIGKYESDGCIRLNQEDMEELFAIVVTKPTSVELVHDFNEVQQ